MSAIETNWIKQYKPKLNNLPLKKGETDIN